MQVQNVLDSLRQGKTPDFTAPVQWTDRMSEWRDDLELYNRLKQWYTQNPTAVNASHWAGFVDSLRPMDWQTFGEFFTQCPRAQQTPMQRAPLGSATLLVQRPLAWASRVPNSLASP